MNILQPHCDDKFAKWVDDLLFVLNYHSMVIIQNLCKICYVVQLLSSDHSIGSDGHLAALKTLLVLCWYHDILFIKYFNSWTLDRTVPFDSTILKHFLNCFINHFDSMWCNFGFNCSLLGSVSFVNACKCVVQLVVNCIRCASFLYVFYLLSDQSLRRSLVVVSSILQLHRTRRGSCIMSFLCELCSRLDLLKWSWIDIDNFMSYVVLSLALWFTFC